MENLISENESGLPTAAIQAPVKLTSLDIKLAIRSSRGAGFQTFFEVGNDTGTNVRRHADAVTIGIWPSTGYAVHGFEVKVSRADFFNEMKDAGKSLPIFRYCHRWSLATPPGLVKVDELPPNWGLITYDGTTVRTVKQAPLLTPEPLSAGFVAAIVRRAGEMDIGLISAAVEKAKREWDAKAKAELDVRISRHRETSRAEGMEALKIVELLKAALGDEYLSAFQVPELVEAMQVVRKMRITGGWSGLQTVMEMLRDSADHIQTELAKIGIEPPLKKGARA